MVSKKCPDFRPGIQTHSSNQIDHIGCCNTCHKDQKKLRGVIQPFDISVFRMVLCAQSQRDKIDNQKSSRKQLAYCHACCDRKRTDLNGLCNRQKCHKNSEGNIRNSIASKQLERFLFRVLHHEHPFINARTCIRAFVIGNYSFFIASRLCCSCSIRVAVLAAFSFSAATTASGALETNFSLESLPSMDFRNF